MTEEKQNLSEDTKESLEETIDETNSPVIKEFLGDDTKEEPKEEIKEVPVEEPEKPVEEPEAPEVPLEEVVEAARTQTKEELKDEVLKALGISEKEKEVVEEAGYQTPWEKRGEDRPSSYKELLDAGLELQEFKQAESAREDAVQKEKVEAQTAEHRKVLNDEWDKQLDYLHENKLIPQIDPTLKTKLDKGEVLTQEERAGDAGLVARRTIFETMAQVGQERDAKGLAPINDVIHIFSRYYKAPKAPAGAKVQVSGGKKSVSQPSDEMSYAELRSSSLEDIVGR